MNNTMKGFLALLPALGLLLAACGSSNAPTIDGLKVDPTTIFSGQSATASWTGVTDEDASAKVTVTLLPDGTDVSNVKQVTVSPTKTTGYTLRASSSSGSRDYPFSITVKPNSAPVVTITSPTDGGSSREDSKVTLAATATDTEDGDVTASIVWTSSIDGALAPDANGQVSLAPGNHTLTATATDSLGGVGSTSIQYTVTALPSATHIATEGRRIHLYAINGNEVLERGVAEIPADGLLAGHQIFNVLQHPTQPWLYAVSLNECNASKYWCWGNGRIDRFVISATGITYAGPVLVEDASLTAMPCTQQDSGFPGQVGYCAPVGMAFNADGSRLFIQDDDADKVQTLTIDPATGNATFLEEGAGTGQHGLVLSADGQYLYSGTNVFSVTGDTTANLTSGTAGNATQLITVGGQTELLTTLGTNALGIYSLATASAPAEVSSLTMASNAVRDVAAVADASRLVTTGRNSVATIAFDGAALTVEHELVLAEAVTIENRGVALTADGTQAAVAWFTVDGTTGARTGGMTVYGIAADGQLTATSTVDYPEEARVVRAIRLP